MAALAEEGSMRFGLLVVFGLEGAEPYMQKVEFFFNDGGNPANNKDAAFLLSARRTSFQFYDFLSPVFWQTQSSRSTHCGQAA